MEMLLLLSVQCCCPATRSGSNSSICEDSSLAGSDAHMHMWYDMIWHMFSQDYLAKTYKKGGRPPVLVPSKPSSKYRLQPPLVLTADGVVLTSLFRTMQDPLYKVPPSSIQPLYIRCLRLNSQQLSEHARDLTIGQATGVHTCSLQHSAACTCILTPPQFASSASGLCCR